MSPKRSSSLIVGGTIAVLIVSYFASPVFRSAIQDALTLLARADIQQMRDYLLGFGAWSPGVSALLMVLQAILLPLPSMALTLANGLLFGPLWGALLSWSSAMVAAIVCYFLARAFGRPLVIKLTGEKPLALTDRFFKRYGRWAILLARLIPTLSFDVVSYAAGLSSLHLGEFALATGIGQLPATLAYSYVGHAMPQAATHGLWIASGAAVLVIIGVALRAQFEAHLLPK